MGRRAAKELLHIRDWLLRADEIVERGKDRYLADELLQEAGRLPSINTTRSTGTDLAHPLRRPPRVARVTAAQIQQAQNDLEA